MMRCRFSLAAVVAALLFFPGLAVADDLSSVSDRDLTLKTREAVVAQDAGAALAFLTEMQRRGTGLFAGTETAECKELIELPEGITDWKFRAVARQAYFRVAMSHRIEEGSCSCLFEDFSFDTFVQEALGKRGADLIDADRRALETIRDSDRRKTEARFRDLTQSCRAN